MSNYTQNSPLHKIKVLITMLVIVIASIWFALASQPVQPVRVVSPDAVVMRRESLEISPEFEEALYQSMRRGYCQAVNWEWAEVA